MKPNVKKVKRKIKRRDTIKGTVESTAPTKESPYLTEQEMSSLHWWPDSKSEEEKYERSKRDKTYIFPDISKPREPLSKKQVKTNRAKTDKAFLSFLEEKKNQEAYERMEDPMWPQSTKNYNTEDAPALDITVDTGPVNYDNDWQQSEDRQPAKGSGNIIVAMVVLCFVFVVGLVIGSFIGASSPQYRDKVEYRYEVKELPENPWGPRKVPLLPEDVKILEGR